MWLGPIATLFQERPQITRFWGWRSRSEGQHPQRWEEGGGTGRSLKKSSSTLRSLEAPEMLQVFFGGSPGCSSSFFFFLLLSSSPPPSFFFAQTIGRRRRTCCRQSRLFFCFISSSTTGEGGPVGGTSGWNGYQVGLSHSSTINSEVTEAVFFAVLQISGLTVFNLLHHLQLS